MSDGKQLPKPTKFDGSVSWEEYCTQFTIIAGANHWDDKELGQHLVAALSGPPLTVVHNLPKQHQSSFIHLAEAFQLRFGSDHLLSLRHSQLQACKQNDGECLAELATDIERLARGAFPDCPPEAVERLAVQSFIHGIRDTTVRSAVSLTSPKSTREALRKAQTQEVDHSVQPNTENTVQPPQRAEYPQQVHIPTTTRCYKCKGVGHFRQELSERNKTEN